jgi:hypothetical protein
VVGCPAAISDFVAAVAATDACSTQLTYVQSPAAGTIVNDGRHDVRITVTDPSGNRSSCTTTFTVLRIPDAVRGCR